MCQQGTNCMYSPFIRPLGQSGCIKLVQLVIYSMSLDDWTELGKGAAFVNSNLDMV